MRQSAATLQTFYSTRLGHAASGLIGQRLLDLWGACEGHSVLVVGYPPPISKLWIDTARACVGVLPEGMGDLTASSARGGIVTTSPENRLPFSDNVFDRIVLLHALEEADSPRRMMRDVWRVLAPEGRVVVVAANRRNFWSINDSQAFGHGRPWTRRQLIRFLGDGLFDITASTTAVYMPPLNWRIITAAARSWERVGEAVLPGLGGVVLVEAVKRLYAKPGGSAPATVNQAAPAQNGVQPLPIKKAERVSKKEMPKTDSEVNTVADRNSMQNKEMG
ncbi:MAG: methyltransferase domain-containing protein [Henriciella sp.]|nr:methyltransferase domain-containing protein [Henriciella sp.]